MDDVSNQTEIDFDHLNQYVGGDVALTKEIFSLFKNQIDLWSKSLRADTDDEVWGVMIHSLKGTARAVGAVQLAEICQNAEGLIGDSNRPGARDVAIEKIESRISRVMIEIQRWEYRQNINELKADSPWPPQGS